jgi:hypothetical protein
MPDLDVLDALGVGVVTICGRASKAFDEPQKWHPYEFNSRHTARVRNPSAFAAEPDGMLIQDGTRMPPSSYVFNELHGGQARDLKAALPRYDLKKYK